jgi:hypothetical protein
VKHHPRSQSVQASEVAEFLNSQLSRCGTQTGPLCQLPPIYPSTSMRAPSVNPSAATTRTPAIDPNPRLGLWRSCKPGATHSHGGYRRPDHLPMLRRNRCLFSKSSSFLDSLISEDGWLTFRPFAPHPANQRSLHLPFDFQNLREHQGLSTIC